MSNLPIADAAGRVPVSIGSGVIYTADPASTPALDFVVTDAVNNNLTTVLTLDHETTGSPASGIGTRLAFNTENSANASIVAGSVAVRLTTVTSTIPVGKFEVATVGQYSGLGTYAVRTIFTATYGAGNAVYVFGVNDNQIADAPVAYNIIGASAAGGSGNSGASGIIQGGTGDGVGQGGGMMLAAGVSGGDSPGADVNIYATNAGGSGVSNVGGSVYIDAGAAGGNAGGGGIFVTAGAASGNGVGGSSVFMGGLGSGSGAGGYSSVVAGHGGKTGTGGVARVYGGDAGAMGTGAGGDIEITAGRGSSIGLGGDVLISGGIGGGSGGGGNATLSGGNAGGSASNGGDVVVSGGLPTSTGNGGNISVSGGDAVDPAGLGGTITITPGDSATAGSGGLFKVNSPDGIQTIIGIGPSGSVGGYSILAHSDSASGVASATCPAPVGAVAFSDNTDTFTIINTLVESASHVFITPTAISAGSYIETVTWTPNTIVIKLNAASATGLAVRFLVINPS